VERRPPMDGPGYEELDHPADVGLRVRGTSRRELFENAARGMIELMVAPETVSSACLREIEAGGEDSEALLVGWLEDILFAFDAERFAPAFAEVSKLEGTRVAGRLWGEEFDEDRHEVRNLIKAVTWHNLQIERSERGYEVTIIFDV